MKARYGFTLLTCVLSFGLGSLGCDLEVDPFGKLDQHGPDQDKSSSGAAEFNTTPTPEPPEDPGSEPDDPAPATQGQPATPSTPPSAPPSGVPGVSQGSGKGPYVTFVIEGSLEDRVPDDGFSGQTPNPYYFGVQKLEFLRTPDDENPEVIFDHSPHWVLADLYAPETIVAKVPIAQLPDGVFNYFRVVLTHVEAGLDVSFHGVPFFGEMQAHLNIIYALSDIDSGTLTMNQGDANIEIDFAGSPMTVPYQLQPAFPPATDQFWVESVDNQTVVNCMFSPPFVVSPMLHGDVTYVMRYYFKDSFRWQDTDAPGYSNGAWDVSLDNMVPSWETIVWFGATKYGAYAR